MTSSKDDAGQAPESAEPSRFAIVPIHDPGTRMYLLTRLINSFEGSDRSLLAQLIDCGLTPDLIDKLRSMSLVDALKFTANQCGLSVSVDGDAVRQQMGNLERSRGDREMYEYFIRAGASPNLISRLFAVSPDDVRRLRKLIAPKVAGGGRPRHPVEPLRSDIETAWRRIRQIETTERQALYLLHQEFTHLTIGTLEAAIRPPKQHLRGMPPPTAWPTGKPLSGSPFPQS